VSHPQVFLFFSYPYLLHRYAKDYHGAAVSPAFIRVKLKPNLCVKVSSLLRLSAGLQVKLELENPPFIAPQAGYVSIDLPCTDRQIAKFEESYSEIIFTSYCTYKNCNWNGY
jgi:hypothetical protein